MNIFRLFILLTLSVAFISCGGIQRVESLEGMVYFPPARSIQNLDTSRIRISCEIFSPINSLRTGRIKRDSMEIHNQFRWQLPKFGFICDLDIYFHRDSVTRKALTFGIGGSYIGNSINAMGNFGYAIEKNYPNSGVRYEFGVTWTKFQSTRFPDYANWDVPIGYHVDPFDPSLKRSSNEFRGGAYSALSFGLRNPKTLWKYNCQISISLQKISGDTRLITHGEETPTSIYFITFTPFVSYDIPGNSQIVGGFRLIRELYVKNTNGIFIIIPFIQYEFSF